MYDFNINHLILSMAVNAILLFCLLAPNIVYLIHRQHFKWKGQKEEINAAANPIVEKKPVTIWPTQKKYWIEHLPLHNKFVAVYNGKYIFKCVGGYFRLHGTPSYHHMHSTKEQAETFLKLYLEWKGKDIVKLDANI